MDKRRDQAIEAIDLYQMGLTKKIEAMPEFVELCREEMNQVLSCFPPEVAEYVDSMRTLSAFEYLEWERQRSFSETR